MIIKKFSTLFLLFIFVCFLFVITEAGEDSSNIETKTLKVAVVSSHSKFCDITANLNHFESLIKNATENRAELVCFPELALLSFTMRKEILEVAEEIPSTITEKLEKIAQSYNVYFSVGMTEKADGNCNNQETIVITGSSNGKEISNPQR